MQKRSHLLLAQSLLDYTQRFPARPYELAFLFGSFQPDCNPFSYLKGSLHAKPFGGHTYANSKSYISRNVRRLQRRKRWNIWHYYTMGKLTHYVADAFTFPHNPHFPGVGWEHHIYESELRLALNARLSGDALSECDACRTAETFPVQLENLHERYLAEPVPGVERDIDYILTASALLVAGCRPASETAVHLPAFLLRKREAGNFA